MDDVVSVAIDNMQYVNVVVTVDRIEVVVSSEIVKATVENGG